MTLSLQVEAAIAATNLCLLAQSVEIEDKKVCIMGAESNLLRTSVAISSSGVTTIALIGIISARSA